MPHRCLENVLRFMVSYPQFHPLFVVVFLTSLSFGKAVNYIKCTQSLSERS